MSHPIATVAFHNGDLESLPTLNGRTANAKLVECRNCGEVVGLVQSKAGKWYTANVYGYGEHFDRPKVAPWAPHFKTCEGSK